MRKKGLLFLLIIIGIILALSFLFTDRWLENRLEAAGSSLVGARVEFEGVDFSLFQLRMKWTRLQVTDPQNTMQNLFETGPAEFDLALEPLLTKKILIENFQLKELRFNTPRESDGRLEREPKKPSESSKIFRTIESHLKQETAQMPVFNPGKYTRKINIDSLWKLVDLKSPKKIDSLKHVYRQKYREWNQRVKKLPTESDFKRLQKKALSLQVDQIKTLKELQAALKTANELYRETDSLTRIIKSVRTDFQKDFGESKAYRQLITEWIDQDYQRALGLAQLPDISVKNVAKVLFGKPIIQKIEKAIGYIGTIRYYAGKLKSGQPKEEKPPRFKGQDIHFPSRKNRPNMWIRMISLSGEFPEGFNTSGKITDITSDQKLIGKPTVIDLSGNRKDGATMQATGTLDYRSEKPAEAIQLHMERIPLANVKLTQFALLPYKIRSGKGNLAVLLRFEGNEFLADIKFTGNRIKFDYSETPNNLNPRLVRISRELAETINTIEFRAKAAQEEGKFRFTIHSNLDKLVADQMKRILSGEVVKARTELEKRVRQQAEKYRKELENLIAQKEGEIRKQIDRAEKELQKQRKTIHRKRKEIEARIAEEKKKLENKAKGKIKNLLKKF